MSYLRLFLIASLITLSACFHSSESDQPSGLEIEADSHLIWKLEESIQLTAYSVDSDGNKTETQPEKVWSSSDNTIASVDENGLVTAHAEGEVVISVVAGGLNQSVTIVVNVDVREVTVQVHYEDKEYNASGFYASSYKPVRHAEVEFLNEGTVLIEKSSLDANGSVTAIVPANGEISLRVISQIDTTETKLDIRDPRGNLFSVFKALSADDIELGNASVQIPSQAEVVGAFNILDVFSLGAEFVHNFSASTVINLQTYWEPGYLNGTFFCTGGGDPACSRGNGIYVLSQTNGDTDEFDDDVLLHEFGHYIASLVSRDDSPGGCHYFDTNDLDLRLAWSEGWGDFFPMAVKTWARADSTKANLLSMHPDIPTSSYVDTYLGMSQLSFDVARLQDTQIDPETQESLAAVHIYASSELAVNKILWQLQESFGMSAVWSIVEDYMPTIGANTYANLESFWDGWLSVHSPDAATKTSLQGIFNERQVYFQEDSFETDNTLGVTRKIALDTPETHYLYDDVEAFDLDYVALDVTAGQRYQVLTDNLTSGADTVMRIVKGDGQLLVVDGKDMDNDDWLSQSAYEYYESGCGYVVSNNKTALSSRLEFVAQEDATYFIEVQNTAAIDAEYYPSAARYGTYDLTVSILP